MGGMQSLGPGLEGLGGGGDGLALFGAGVEVDVVEVGLAIGAIQADDQVEGRGRFHEMPLVVRPHATLTRRRQYRRVLM